MNYEKIYKDLIDSRKLRGLTKESGFEIHHITPTSFGGCNSKDNLVKLTFREHYIAHKLLALIYKNVSKDKYSKSIYSLWIIGNSKEKVRNSREYKWVKEEYERVTLPKLRVNLGHPKDVFRTYYKKNSRVNILKQYLNTPRRGRYSEELIRHFYISRKVTPRKLKEFLDFCVAVMWFGFDKISLSTDMTRYYTNTKDLLIKEKNPRGFHYTFSDKFKELYGGYNGNAASKVLSRCLVEGKPLSGTRAALVEWNNKNPTELIYAETVDGLTRFYPLNNWDTTDVHFITEPLDYNTIKEFRKYISERNPR